MGSYRSSRESSCVVAGTMGTGGGMSVRGEISGRGISPCKGPVVAQMRAGISSAGGPWQHLGRQSSGPRSQVGRRSAGLHSPGTKSISKAFVLLFSSNKFLWKASACCGCACPESGAAAGLSEFFSEFLAFLVVDLDRVWLGVSLMPGSFTFILKGTQAFNQSRE